MYLLDGAAYNSFVLHKLKNPEKYDKNKCRSRRCSLEQLAIELIMPQVSARYEILRNNNFKSIHSVYHISLDSIGFKRPSKEINEHITNVDIKTRALCNFKPCPTNVKRSKQPNICIKCNGHFCINHCSIKCVCIYCDNNEQI